LFRGISACPDQLAVQIRELLIIERNRRTTAREPALLAKICRRFFRLAKLPAQFDQAVAKPTRGPLGRLKTSVELVDDIGIGYRVGRLAGSHWISPSDANVDPLSLPPAQTRQRPPQAIYSIYNGSFRRRIVLVLRCGLRFLCTRWRKPLLDDDP